MPIKDVIRGALKITGLKERQCFSSWQDFLEALPKLLSVEVPAGSSGVVVQQPEPGADDRDKLWVRRNGAGGIIGLYAFQGGHWQPLYDSAPGEIHWLTPNSNQVPEGYVLIDDGDPTLPSSVVTSLKALYLPLLSGGGYYYYAARFKGF